MSVNEELFHDSRKRFPNSMARCYYIFWLLLIFICQVEMSFLAMAHRINCVMWVCAWVHAYVSTSRRPTVLSSQATSFVYFDFGNCENKQDTRHIYSKTTNILNELIPKLWKLQCIWKENIYSLIYDERLKLFNCNVMFHNWLVKLTLCIAIETFLSCVNL